MGFNTRLIDPVIVGIAEELIITGLRLYKSASGVITVDDGAGGSVTLIGAGKIIGGNPRARVYHNANQTIATGTLTALAFNSERWDTDTIHDTATNNSRLTAKTAGLYDIFGNFEYGASAVNNRAAYIRLNGTTLIAAVSGPVDASGTTYMNLSTQYVLAVNDYVELMAFQNSGGNLTVFANGNYSPEFGMSLITA